MQTGIPAEERVLMVSDAQFTIRRTILATDPRFRRSAE
jgi:hypothetical protein